MPDELPVPETIPDNVGMVLSPNRFSSWSGKYAHDGGCELSFLPNFARRTPLTESLVKAILHVDIDNTAPLNVVSLHLTQESQNPLSWHVIGRVNKNKSNLSVPELVVDELHFIGVTPGMTLPVELEVTLSRTPGSNPQAEVSFFDRSNRTDGPINFKRISTYFREVEVKIDQEEKASNPEKYNTYSHPDRPGDLQKEELTIESVFAKSGIKITRSPGSGIINASDVSGEDDLWTKAELHKAMEDHWNGNFPVRPQWKIWIFLSKLLYIDSSFLGLMFDANIEAKGGLDRQGAVIFTDHGHHLENGDYNQANSPPDKAAQRQLFVTFIHESGHAFNLPHPPKEQGQGRWDAPDWMPQVTSPLKSQDYTWMLCPWFEKVGRKVSWFYNQFRFRFNDAENLFLRHASAPYVQMGNESFLQNHALVSRESLDPRLEFIVRSLKPVMELGEPVFVELRLRNKSHETVTVHDLLNPHAGIVELAITNPKGERRPFIPFIQSFAQPGIKKLVPKKEDRLYESVNLTMGRLGFPFKEPGTYRIEASYRNLDGRAATGCMEVLVRSCSHTDETKYINELFNARVGRVLYVGGSRMEDVNDKIDWIFKHIGESHPASYHLTAARFMPYAKSFKRLQADTKKIKVLPSDPDKVFEHMNPVVAEKDMTKAADTIGHIAYHEIVDAYANCAIETNRKTEARHVKNNLLELFRQRKVIQAVIKKLEREVKELS